MESNPSLWLHLAECCIMSTKKTFATDVRGLDPRNVHSNEKPSNPVLAAVGTGTHRKIILSSSPASNSTTEAETSSTLTLEYAAQCLKNALQFCGHPEIEEGSVITTSSSPRGNGNSSSANSSTQASPLKSTTTVNRNLLLRASILINSSYVALCLNNPILALDFSERLLEFNKNCILVSLLFALLHLLVTRQLFSWRKWVIPIIASIVKQIGKLTICCLILLFIKTTTDQFGQTCFLFAILKHKRNLWNIWYLIIFLFALNFKVIF